jgi:quinol monooxygenase YgiN
MSETTDQAFVVIVTFEVHAEHIADFRQAVVENAALSAQREPGCQVFDVCEHPEQAVFVLYEVYDSPAAFDVHLASAHFEAFNAASAPWVQSKNVARYKKLKA